MESQSILLTIQIKQLKFGIILINPYGLIELSFLFETSDNDTLLIKPIILNWQQEYSKKIEIKPNEIYKLNPQITHWELNDIKLEKSDFVITGKLKAIYFVQKSVEQEKIMWQGKIISSQENVILKHNQFANSN